MTFVHKLSTEGMTVCATIHSPSPFTFHLFERLLLMAGGRIVYFGDNGDRCVDYLFTSGEWVFNLDISSMASSYVCLMFSQHQEHLEQHLAP